MKCFDESSVNIGDNDDCSLTVFVLKYDLQYLFFCVLFIYLFINMSCYLTQPFMSAAVTGGKEKL